MTRGDYISLVRENYSVVKLLSNKNDCTVLQLRHNSLGKDMVLRSHPTPIAAYNHLKGIIHPNLPQVYDLYDFPDGQVVLEEYIEGITVAQVIESGKYTYSGAKKIIYGVGNALISLHGANIIHRDIKPENIIVTTKGIVKLIDFNASREHSIQKGRDTVALGTIGYAPPEQFGISQSDATADIYALGVLLNVMLTGRHPSEELAKGKAGKIVLKCTSIDPGSRFQSVEKLIKAL